MISYVILNNVKLFCLFTLVFCQVVVNIFKDTNKPTITKVDNDDAVLEDGVYYLKNNNIPCDTISGLSDNNNFNSNLASYIDMKNIFENAYSERDFEMYETLIYWITVFEDKKILKEKIEKTYKKLSSDNIKQLLKLNYSGWSRLSNGEKSYQNESIMEILENTKMNFMQIINNSQLGFDKIIENQIKK